MMRRMKTALRVALLAALVPAGSACGLVSGLITKDGSLIPKGQETLQDSVTSGLTSAAALDAEPPGVRVTWIKWDSGFRRSGLAVGDRVIAVDGKPFVKPATLEELQRVSPKLIGQYAEDQTWKERGASDGSELTLTVLRRAPSGVGLEQLEIKGKLRAERVYSSDSGRRLIGPGGPEELGNDGFDGAWSSWYEQQTRLGEKVLDFGWTQQRFTSRNELQSHLEHKKRVDFLVEKYPGPFADAVKEDWQRVRASLAGNAYALRDADFAYRRLGEQRAAEIADAGKRAREAFLKAQAANTIAAFPAIDPIRGDRRKVAGKVVVLPLIGNRNWVSEGGHCYLTASDGKGWYFVDCDAAATGRMMTARYRYEKLVTPQVHETYAIVGRIKSSPKMLVIGGRAVTGLEVDPLGATIGEQLFVDLTQVKSNASPFAGEEALLAPAPIKLPDSASPRQVMDAFVAALKSGDVQIWKGLFAPWRAENWKEEGVIYYPFYEIQVDNDWVNARRSILDRVYDARVVYQSEARHVLTGKEFPKAPVIDEVMVELDHIGLFDGEYRSFTDVTVHRTWLLQRRDGGPWRIASVQGI
jgi:hypothetical protein